jgi:hypothetical protein
MRLDDLVKEIDKAFHTVSEGRRRIAELLDEIYKSIENVEIKIDDHVIDSSVWNNLGFSFYFEKAFLDMQAVYSHMLRTIQKIEKKENRRIHKGLALFNMGIAQTNIGNMEHGITNILLAKDEDSKTFGNLASSKPASQLFIDYVNNIAKEIGTNYSSIMQANLKNPLHDSSAIIGVLELGEQLFLSRILRARSTEFLGDISTRTTLFDALRDLCLLIEEFLRRKSGKPNMLGGLILNIFGTQAWITATNFKKLVTDKKVTSASSSKDFDKKLSRILSTTFDKDNEKDFLMKIFLTCVLVRNFTAHNFDLSISVLSKKSQYDSVSNHITYGLLYCMNSYV